MGKLEKILGALVLVFIVTAFSGAALDKKAIIYENDRTVSRSIFYGGVIGNVVSIFGASCAYDRNNRKKEPDRNYKKTNK